MIAGKDFVYLQMPKTGTETLGEILLRIPGTKFVRPKHAPLKKRTRKAVIGSIRSPWSYYVSLWSFRHGRPNCVAPALWCHDPHWGKFYTTPKDISTFQSWLRAIRHQPRGLGDRYYAATKGKCGYMTYNYRKMFKQPVAVWLHLETLADDLHTLFDFLNVEYDDVEEVSNLKLHETDHLPYTEYYDSECRNIVSAWDSLILEEHDYAFGD